MDPSQDLIAALDRMTTVVNRMTTVAEKFYQLISDELLRERERLLEDEDGSGLSS